MSNPVILVQGKDNLPSVALKDDLKGTMRAIHKLSPTQDDDFALNDMNDFSEAVSSYFWAVEYGRMDHCGYYRLSLECLALPISCL